MNRLTYSAAHQCGICHGERVGEVLRRAQLSVRLEDDQLVEATYWLCDGCIGELGGNVGGFVLRRTLLRWRDSLPRRTPPDGRS